MEVELSSSELTHEFIDDFEKISLEFIELFPETGQSSARRGPKVFLGHGGASHWRDLRDHLRDKHGYEVIAFVTGARAGHTIRDIVEEMASSSDIAFLVHSAEDELATGRFQSRPNVIHETGLFQGKLGFAKAIVLLEDGCEEFSNLYGIQQIRYLKNNIKETFGDVLATIRREFGS